MSRLGWIAVVVVIVASSQAFAQTPKDEFAAGQKAYAAKDYLGAAKHFVTAYALEPDPAYLFNIAQAYRLGDDCKSAAEYYQRYLDSAQDPPNADEVRARLTEQRACAAKRVVPVAPPPNTSRPGPAPHLGPDDGPHSGLRKWSYLAGGIGVAALAAGGGFSVYGDYLTDQHAAACSRTHQCSGDLYDSYKSRGHRANVLAAVGYSVGGAAVIGAGVLWYMSQRDRDAEQKIAVTPTRGGFAVSAQLRF